MSLPDTIRIGGITYTVKVVERLTGDTGRLDGEIKYGSTEILVDGDLNEQGAFQTMWHEVLHGILTQSGRWGEDHKKLEGIVEAIAYGLVQVLADNPGLAAPPPRNVEKAD